MILIKGARVLMESGLAQSDVLIDHDNVVELGALQPPPGATVVRAEGLVLGPGLVDLHVHFREPGETWKEDIATGSQAAAAGGFTAVVVMPNTIPVIDNPALATEVRAIGRRVGLVDLAVAGAITSGRQGKALADITGMHQAGVRIFSDDGSCVADTELLRKAMEIITTLPGAIIAQHAEDAGATAGGHMHEGELSRALAIGGLASSAESDIVRRDVRLATETRAHLHVQHVSSAESVALVEAAKTSGARVSAEVTPHHLCLTEEAVRGLDADYKMYPPLRSAADRAALVDGLKRGVIDLVATDHAPHTSAEKALGFQWAPRGVIGLETALPIVIESLGGDLGLVFECMSMTPARIGGLSRHGHPVSVGRPANLVLVDPSARWKVDGFRSKSSNSPFVGRTLSGRVMATIFEGRIVYRSNMQ